MPAHCLKEIDHSLKNQSLHDVVPEVIFSLRYFLTESDKSDWVRDSEYLVLTQSSGHSLLNIVGESDMESLG